MTKDDWEHLEKNFSSVLDKVSLRFAQRSVSNEAWSFSHAIQSKSLFTSKQVVHRRSQYEANRGTRLGKILSNTVDFYFFLSDW